LIVFPIFSKKHCRNSWTIARVSRRLPEHVWKFCFWRLVVMLSWNSHNLIITLILSLPQYVCWSVVASFVTHSPGPDDVPRRIQGGNEPTAYDIPKPWHNTWDCAILYEKTSSRDIILWWKNNDSVQGVYSEYWVDCWSCGPVQKCGPDAYAYMRHADLQKPSVHEYTLLKLLRTHTHTNTHCMSYVRAKFER
jgi:hypothetical protein